jgi:CRP-like cAMP-binding protein
LTDFFGFLLGRIVADRCAGVSPTITLPAKKSLIASRLNLTQEHFSRILRNMQSAGLIAVRDRQIRLLDPGRLRSLPDR